MSELRKSTTTTTIAVVAQALSLARARVHACPLTLTFFFFLFLSERKFHHSPLRRLCHLAPPPLAALEFHVRRDPTDPFTAIHFGHGGISGNYGCARTDSRVRSAKIINSRRFRDNYQSRKKVVDIVATHVAYPRVRYRHLTLDSDSEKHVYTRCMTNSLGERFACQN